jgi:hypothetical protein
LRERYVVKLLCKVTQSGFAEEEAVCELRERKEETGTETRQMIVLAARLHSFLAKSQFCKVYILILF